PLPQGWDLHAAYTRLDARFTDVGGCTASCDIASGARIPGVARNQLYGELSWRGGSGWHAGIDAFALGDVFANDADSARATGYAVVGLDAGRIMHWGDAAVAPFLRIDNLFDRRYIGSVIVNDGNGRYFEPASGRSVMLGIRVRFDERASNR